jgi:transposase
MPRPAYRFVQSLSEEQKQQLKHIRDTGKTRRSRHRAHAVLLSHDGKEIREIAEIFQVNRNTVSNWLDRWDAKGIDGLADKPHPGAPPKLKVNEQKLALELIGQSPQRLDVVLNQIEQQTGKRVSASTLKRLARASNLRWKRMRKSLRSKRDQKNFAPAA